MKKSIYKVTGWSLAISAAILFGIHKNNIQALPVSSGIGYVSNSEENNMQPTNDGQNINYNTEGYANNDRLNNGIDASIIAPSTSKSQDIASVEGMGLLENKNDNVPNNFNSEEANTQDALAKGGPNNNTEIITQQYVNPSVSSGTNNGGSAKSSSVGEVTVTSARTSAPTIVTAPPNPSGGSTGGSGSGDPFVPIDDYYGLIFLIVVSTLVGVFTIKKSKMM
ncbi:MAG: hypothetical protein ACOVMM_02500 [Chitinophagaceae bacterium]